MPYTLAYKDRFKRVPESRIESDTSNSIAFPYMAQNEPNKLIAEWTGTQFTKLFSALYTGANLMFPDEANEIIWQLLKVVHQPITLEDEDEGGCINFMPYAPFINYLPANPYNEPDFVPEGYLTPPFVVNSAFEYPEEFGYLATDVMVPLSAITAPDSWEDLVALPFPTIKMHVVGQGQVELDLLQVVAGGRAIIKVGSPPNILDIIDGVIETGVTIVELGQDVTSLPPESDLISAQEIPIDAPEGTDLYIVFVPAIDISTELFNHGGGLRRVGLCGLETDGEMAGIEDIRLRLGETAGNAYMLEKRIAGEWLPVINWDEFMSSYLATTYVNALDGVGIARALRNIEPYEGFSGEEGWPDSPLKDYIDGHDEVIHDIAVNAAADASAAEGAAAAAGTAAAAAQSTANGAVSVNTTQAGQITAIQGVNSTQSGQISALQAAMVIAQSDILATDARVDIGFFGGTWAWVHDFTAAGIYTATIGSWSSGFGWNSVGQALDMNYPLINPQENQITHTCIEIVSNNGSYPVLEWTWSGVGLADEWLAVDWQGVGAINKCWMRFPNHNFIIGNLRLKVRIDTGSFTVRKMTYLGRGENIPLA